MAIQFIDNQPIDFRASLPSDSSCKAANGCDDYCSPYQIGDPLKFQFKYSPCNTTNQFCNPSLDNSNAEMITNGNFGTNPAGQWTIGTGWAWDSVNLRMNRTSTSSGSLTQTIGGLTNGATYVVSFKLTNRFIADANMTVSLGGTTYGTTIRNFGTYNILITAGAGSTIVFTSNVNQLGLDDVSVKLCLVGTSTSDCLYVDSSATVPYWVQLVPNTLTHNTGDANSLHTKISIGSSTGYLKIKFKVTGYTGIGNFNLNYYNTNTGIDTTIANVADNGDFEFYCQYYVNLGDTDIRISWQPGSDCTFTLSNIEIYDMTSTASIMLVNDATGQVYSYPSLNYDREFVTASFNTNDFLEGQYRICVYDLCINHEPDNIQVVGDPNFNTCQWIPPNGLSSCSTGTHINTIVLRNTTDTYDFNPIIWDNDFINTNIYGQYFYDIKTGDITAGTQLRLEVYNQANNTILCVITDDLQPNDEITGYVNILRVGTLQPVFRLVSSGFPADLSYVEFQKISLIQKVAYPGDGTSNCSNCIDLRTVQKCTNWVEGICDQEAFGFNFNHFSLAGRVRSMFINPKYKGSLSNYSDSDGQYTVTKANSGKHYQFVIDYAPERTHDWLRLAVICDQVRVGSAYNNYKTWINTEGDYQPEWPDSLGNFPLAQCKLEFHEKIDEKYNNNAG